MRTVLVRVALAVSGLTALAACGTDGGEPLDARPTVVVTTNILGDVVERLVGDDAVVEVLMPVGADPHDFAPSARQAADVRAADVVVANGLGFEAALEDTISAAAADGVRVLEATDAITPLPFTEEPGSGDPHFFSDPARMVEVAGYLAQELAAELPALDAPEAKERVTAYLAELEALDAEVEAMLAAIPPERRVLVTNHEVFAYFADRYDFEVLGAVVPGGSTLAEPSAADLAELAGLIDQRGVPAIFADTSSPARVLEALAAEGAQVQVVELYSESLGEAGSAASSYLGMVRTNAERIAAALG